jgi:hypothetical protein
MTDKEFLEDMIHIQEAWDQVDETIQHVINSNAKHPGQFAKGNDRMKTLNRAARVKAIPEADRNDRYSSYTHREGVKAKTASHNTQDPNAEKHAWHHISNSIYGLRNKYNSKRFGDNYEEALDRKPSENRKKTLSR